MKQGWDDRDDASYGSRAPLSLKALVCCVVVVLVIVGLIEVLGRIVSVLV